MRVKLSRSPRNGKKFRVEIQGGPTIDFGCSGASDYTIHRSKERMFDYVRRHGGAIPKRTTRDNATHESMDRVARSSRERWSDPHTTGFWSRWLLWSRPSLAGAKRLIARKFKIKFVR